VGLGRRGPSAPAVARARTDTVYLDPAGTRVAARVDTVRERDTRAVVITGRGDTLRGAAADSALGARTGGRVPPARPGDPKPVTGVATARVDTVRIAPRPGETSYASDRTVAVVVPREGEITVRYGPASPVATAMPADAELREEIRAALRAAMRGETGSEQPVDVRPRAGAGQPHAAGLTRDDLHAEIRAAVRDELAAAGSRPDPTPRSTVGIVPRTTRQRAAPARDPVLKGDAAATGASAATATMIDTARDSAQAAYERRLLDSVDARVRERLDAYARADAEAREREAAEHEAAERRVSGGDVARDVGGAAQPPARRRQAFGGATLYSGGAFSGGAQALVGGRFDLGEISPSLPGFHLVPEVAFGTGSGGTTTLVAANATYLFGGVRLGVLGRVRPQLGVGLGLLNFGSPVGGRSGTDLVVNPAYGLTADPAFARPLLRALTLGGVTPALLVEHQGVGLFDVNRLVLGVTWRR
jgi:hypothetical protein